ncbi:MAG: hypothetical protein KA401_03485 [Anaerolineae bacterium]|nr:hypothetical protein [Chloroflexota bacterium]MBP6298386.1 hypothetical protein [Anaerolineae bacterium]
MFSNIVNVDHDISILGMLRLDDTDNILISRLEAIWKYHDMLLSRLTKIDRRDVKIHLRSQLLNADIERYLPYLEDGTQMMLWQGDPLIHARNLKNLTVVRMALARNSRPEGFLVIRTPSSSRLLAAWQDANNQVVGVLVTNPLTVEKVADQLDAIIQAAAH